MSGYATPAAQPANILDRLTVIPIHAAAGANLTLTSMPAAATLLAGSVRHLRQVDLSAYRQIRFCLNVMGTPGPAGSKMIARYYTARSATAGDYLDIGTSEVAVSMAVADVNATSAWIDLAAGAKADIIIGIVTSGGNGSASPIVGAIDVQVR